MTSNEPNKSNKLEPPSCCLQLFRHSFGFELFAGPSLHLVLSVITSSCLCLAFVSFPSSFSPLLLFRSVSQRKVMRRYHPHFSSTIVLLRPRHSLQYLSPALIYTPSYDTIITTYCRSFDLVQPHQHSLARNYICGQHTTLVSCASSSNI